MAAHPPRNRQVLTGKGTKHVSMLTGILMYTPGM